MSDDFDPTTGDFNSGRLPESGASVPEPRRRPPSATASMARSYTPVPPPYRPQASFPSSSASTPRTPTSTDSDGGLGWTLLLAAVVAALFFTVGQPRQPSTTTQLPKTTAPTQSETADAPNRTIAVLPPDATTIDGLTRDGDRITVTSREVVLEAPWVIDRPTVIRGRGRDASTIVYTGAGTLLTFVGEGTLRVEGVTLARRSTDPGNVVSVESGTLELDGARLLGGIPGRGYSGAGLALDGNANARIESAALESNVIGIRLLTRASAQVVNSDIRHNHTIGIAFADHASGEIRDSRVQGNGGEGIVLTGESTASISGNRILENGARGLSFLQRSSGTATRNEVSRNGYGANRDDYWQGVAVQDEAHPVLEDNTVRDNAGVGIQYLHDARGTVRANTITGNSANLATYLEASGRTEASAGDLVLGLLGQPHDPQPTVDANRVSGNRVGGVVDYRPGAVAVQTPAPAAPKPSPAPPTADAAPSPLPTPPASAPAATAPPAAANGPTAPPPTAVGHTGARYVLSSTADGTGPLDADGHLNVYLDDVSLHADARPPNAPPIAPLTFDARRGASLWVEVVNTLGEDCGWTDVYLVEPNGRSHRVLRGHAAAGGCRQGLVALVEFVVP